MLPATTPTDPRPWRIAFAATFIVVTVLTHLPSTAVLGPEHIPPDKLMHFAAFGLMALLLERSRWMPSVLAIVCFAVWVPFDEWTQGLLSARRESEIADVIGGWMGVLSAGCLAFALQPSGTPAMRKCWMLYISTLDRLIGQAGGGIRSAVVGAAAAVATLVVVYTIWFNAGLNHAGTLSMLIAMLAGSAVWTVLFRRAWANSGGPILPHIRLAWWALAVLVAVPAFMVGAGLGEYDIPSIGTPAALCAASIALSIGLQRALYWACVRASADDAGESTPDG